MIRELTLILYKGEKIINNIVHNEMFNLILLTFCKAFLRKLI